MKNVQENATGNAFSFRNPQTLHILIESFCFLVVGMYVRKNVKRLQNQIDDLRTLVQQQQEMLYLHQQLLQRGSSAPPVSGANHRSHAVPNPPPSSPTREILDAPPLPDFGKITSLFHISTVTPDMDLEEFGHGDHNHVTIVDTSSSPSLPTNESSLSGNGGGLVTAEELEKELEEEMKELKAEEERQSLDSSPTEEDTDVEVSTEDIDTTTSSP